MPNPRIGLLLGDPCGVGPEVAAKLLARPDTATRADVLVLGDREVFAAGQRAAEVALQLPEAPEGAAPRNAAGPVLRHIEFVGREACPPGRVSAQAGAHVLELLRQGADLAASGALDALVFAPLNKQAMAEGGLEQEDELRFLAEHLGCRNHVCELNAVDDLWSSRVTSHIPDFGSRRGDHGGGDRGGGGDPAPHFERFRRCGTQDRDLGAQPPRRGGRPLRAPGDRGDRARGIDALGPLPADTVFLRAQREGLDGVVSMFHDQCQIAMKLIGFDRGVTVLAGLPFPVATAAHGTAFDIVGQGKANPEPMIRAFDMALSLAGTASADAA